MKQGRLEASFDIAELMAEGRLRQTESGTSGCDAAFLDNSLDQLEVAQLEIHRECKTAALKYHARLSLNNTHYAIFCICLAEYAGAIVCRIFTIKDDRCVICMVWTSFNRRACSRNLTTQNANLLPRHNERPADGESVTQHGHEFFCDGSFQCSLIAAVIVASASSKPNARRSCRSARGSGDGYFLGQIHVLDRIQQLDAFLHRTLEGLAAGDQARAAGALVDYGRRHRGFEIARALGFATAVDEAGAAHVAIGDLIAAEVDRVVAAQIRVNALVELAVA